MSKTIKISILIAALAVLLISGIINAAPRLTLPETSFDFGYVPQHSKISHKFWLISSGDDSLKIIKIVPG
jgi:hypothetical protein